MTDTEAKQPDALKGIYARYREIAPDADPQAPDPSGALAVSLLVHAQRDWTRTLSPAEPFDHAMITAMCARFAAAHLLVWLRREQPEAAALLAGQIVSAWNDGGSIGEWLWEHAQPLGIDTAAVSRLAETEATLNGAKQADAEKAALEMAQALDLAMKGVESLGKMADSRERALYSVWIDLQRNDPKAALRLLAEQLDGFDEPAWNGKETGMEWLNRMRAMRQAAPPAEAQDEADAKPEPRRM